MKHKWESNFSSVPHSSYRCSVCKTIVQCEADWCDSDGIVEWLERIAKRDDCPGKRNEQKKTVVVNRHYKSYTKYTGRGTKFGNKYEIGPDGTREDVIAKHKKDFYNNPELQEAVWNELSGEVLECFCNPLACHGDTYMEYIKNREGTENETI